MVSTNGYQAARAGAAILERDERGRIVVSGGDRASYLQGLLTNDVQALKAGEGCYAAYLTPQGRMIADVFVYELGDVILLTVPLAQTKVVLERLDQMVFSEDVQLGDATGAFRTRTIVGPDAARILSVVLGMPLDDLSSLSTHGNRRVQYDGQPAIVTRVVDTGEPGFDVHVDLARADPLTRAITSTGAMALEPADAEAMRIESGTPAFNRDMNEETIPLEAGIEQRAISFTKGCYVGQEVIIRVLHRGHGRVARKLVGLTLDGHAAPSAGATITADGRDVGHVTSSAFSPALQRPIALAYVHRDVVAPGTVVSVDGVRAEVTKLPFVSAR